MKKMSSVPEVNKRLKITNGMQEPVGTKSQNE